MPTTTYTPIASVTLSASASEVVFSGLPQTYRDLILVVNGASTSGIIGATIRFNGDSGSNYSVVDAQGTGSSTGSGSGTGTSIEIGVLTTTRSNFITQIMDYSATDKHKTLLGRTDGAADRTRMLAGRWANTSAITSISITASTLASGTTLNLFGVIA